MELVIKGVDAVLENRILRNAYIHIKDGYIASIGEAPLPKHLVDKVERIDAEVAMPGFVDTHTHGLMGIDVSRLRKPEEIQKLVRSYARYGVTSMLLSTITMPLEDIAEVCRAVGEALESYSLETGSRILGIHLEGPYLNPQPEYAGAQDPRYMRKPDVKEVEALLNRCRGLVRKVTIAPELPGALEVIEHLVGRGISVSVGHSGATYEEALRAIERGAMIANHLFNGMRGIHHREPGAVFAYLRDPRTFLELIVDMIHVHPEVVRFVLDHAGPDRVVVVSDSIAAAGLPDGEYSLGDLRIVVEKGVSRIASTGRLAGSTLTLDRALLNLYSLGYPLTAISRMLSYTPLRSIGLGGLGAGLLKPGYRADVVLLSRDLEVRGVLIGGVSIF